MSDKINIVDEEVQGQPQAKKEAVVQPFDGKVRVQESSFKGDEVILDPNSKHAVQTPEGSGGTSVDRVNPLTEQLQRGTAEEQFEDGADKPTSADNS